MPAWIQSLIVASATLAASAAVFAALAFAVKGRQAWDGARAAAAESRINLVLCAVDHLAVAPIVALLTAWATGLLVSGMHLPALGFGRITTCVAVVIAGDFVGYWRHRAQHSRLLWPAHAIHHSDTQLTWLSLERMHPIDRLGTAFDTVILGALGFPVWALAVNGLVRHYYGYFIHADVPWTFGKASLLLNSPAMHRWHHARDVEGSGSNFATVFAVWDRLFGTYWQPGPCAAPLGVTDNLGAGVTGQYLHPLKAWWAGLAPQLRADRLLGRGHDPA